MNVSFWEEESFLKPVDVLIIGSGIVGLQSAIQLKQRKPNWDILICERGSIPNGASTKNAGFGCLGSPTELLADLSCHHSGEVWDLVAARFEGLQLLKKQVSARDMNWEHHGGFEVFFPTSPYSSLPSSPDLSTISYQDALDALPTFNQEMKKITGIDSYFQPILSQNSSSTLAPHLPLIYIPFEGQLHPGKLIHTLYLQAQYLGIRFLMNWEVKEISTDSQGICVISQHRAPIKASQLLIATNGFTHRLYPELAVKPARNQVLLTEEIPQLSIKGCFHFDKGYVYFRNVGKRILIGGARHLALREESTDHLGETNIISQALLKLLSQIYPTEKDIAITHQWSGILGIGENKFPIIEEIRPGIFTAVRLGGMGVALGSWLAHKVVAFMLSK